MKAIKQKALEAVDFVLAVGIIFLAGLAMIICLIIMFVREKIWPRKSEKLAD